MTRWSDGTLEERVLLNPAFCANLLWHFAAAGSEEGNRQMTFVESFLVLPIVLHRSTREALPRSTRTSLSVWLDENPSRQAIVAARAKALVPFTKDAFLFGGLRQFIRLENDVVFADMTWRRRVNASLRLSTSEAQVCAKKANFIGSWFSGAGNATTVMALIGVRP